MRRILLFGLIALSLLSCTVPQGNNATPPIAPTIDTPIPRRWKYAHSR
jgi:hypothetical protein